jgi:hypothetical protein
MEVIGLRPIYTWQSTSFLVDNLITIFPMSCHVDADDAHVSLRNNKIWSQLPNPTPKGSSCRVMPNNLSRIELPQPSPSHQIHLLPAYRSVANPIFNIDDTIDDRVLYLVSMFSSLHIY